MSNKGSWIGLAIALFASTHYLTAPFSILAGALLFNLFFYVIVCSLLWWAGSRIVNRVRK